MTTFIKITHDGPRNAAVQIIGYGARVWFPVVRLVDLIPKPHKVKVDAVYYAVSDKMEVQLAWVTEENRTPFLPISGRGKIDFSEVSGLVSPDGDRLFEIEMRVLSESLKEPSDQLFAVVLDLSKHIGEE